MFDCLAAQPLLNPEMRNDVLKWICSVNRQFRFHLETLCLTVALLDRFLFAQGPDPMENFRSNFGMKNSMRFNLLISIV